jgi:hypothetical protein
MTILKMLLSVVVIALGISGAAHGQTTTFHDALARDWQGADQRRWLDDESGVQGKRHHERVANESELVPL